MTLRQKLLVGLVAVLAAPGAQFRTTNFTVNAPTPQIAQQVGQLAEQYRKEKAIQWLGQEMPNWPEPCPIQVKVTMSGAGGATSFAFDQGRVLSQQMTIEGALERLLNSVLPHEVTHTVFAYHFRRPVPRWADEGGAVLSEDDAERTRHDQLCRQILNSGRAIPLRRLLGLKDYPNDPGDVMALYAEGYSVTAFLVQNSSRPAFLNFVAHAMQHGWDNAIQAHYRYRNVEELEQAWLTHLRNTKRQPQQPPVELAANPRGADRDPNARVVLRQTAPPSQPFDAPPPIIRGASPEPENKPGYLPNYDQPPTVGLAPPWSPPPPMPQPANRMEQRPPSVQLGPPQFAPRAN